MHQKTKTHQQSQKCLRSTGGAVDPPRRFFCSLVLPGITTFYYVLVSLLRVKADVENPALVLKKWRLSINWREYNRDIISSAAIWCICFLLIELFILAHTTVSSPSCLRLASTLVCSSHAVGWNNKTIEHPRIVGSTPTFSTVPEFVSPTTWCLDKLLSQNHVIRKGHVSCLSSKSPMHSLWHGQSIVYVPSINWDLYTQAMSIPWWCFTHLYSWQCSWQENDDHPMDLGLHCREGTLHGGEKFFPMVR